ncbi:MAG: M20/M25/M40 family metallo-hydrolase [bacterium]
MRTSRRGAGTLLSALLLLPVTAGAQSPLPELPDPGPVGEAAYTHVRVLAGRIGARPAGSEAEAEGMVYAERTFRALGCEVRREPVGVLDIPGEWSSSTWSPDRFLLGAHNLVAVKPGDRPAIVLSAHMDTVDRLAPGANDDASGVAAVLEAARLLRDLPTRHEIRFVIFTGEEDGLIGATHYAAGLEEGEVGAVVNADPLGFGPILSAPMPTAAPLWFQQAARDEARRRGLGRFDVVPAWVLLPRLMPLPYGADHRPFLERGIPAWTLSNRMERWSYHTPLDLPENLDPRTLGEGTLLMASLALRFDREMPVPGEGDILYGVLPLPWVTYLPSGNTLWLWTLAGLLAAAGVFLLGRTRFLPRPVGALRSLVIAGAFGFGAGLPALLDRILTGYLHPWMAHTDLFTLAGLTSGLLAAWLAARLSASVRPRSPDRDLGGAVLLMGLHALAVAVVVGPDGALPFAWATLWLVAALFTVRALPGKTGGWAALVLLIPAFWPLASALSPRVLREAVTLMGWSVPPLATAALRAWLAWPVALVLQGLWPALSGTRPEEGTEPSGAALRASRPAVGLLLTVLTVAGSLTAWMLPAYRSGFRQLVEVDVYAGADGMPRNATVWSWDRLLGMESAWEVEIEGDTRARLRVPEDAPSTGWQAEARFDTVGTGGGWTQGELLVEVTSPALADGIRLTFASSDSARVGDRWLVESGSGHRLVVMDAGADFTYLFRLPVSVRTGAGLSLHLMSSVAGDLAGTLFGPSAARRSEVVVDPAMHVEVWYRFPAQSDTVRRSSR